MKPADTVLVYQSELDYLSRCILDYPHIETGGQLFGYWTSAGVPVVLYAIGPGDNANHQPTFFNQDLDYLETVGEILVHEFGLQHIGEWHSHHQLGLAYPSGHDAHTIYDNMLRHNLRWFLLCIGNCTNTTSTINAFNFVESTSCYQESQWEVLPMESPFRKVIDRRLKRILRHPYTKTPVLVGMKYKSMVVQGVKQQYPKGYWMNDKSNNKVLKTMLDFVQEQHDDMDCNVSLDENRLVHILVKNEEEAITTDILFPMGFPERSPLITYETEGLCASGLGWQPIEGETEQSFIEYYKLHRL
ncbi:MAG: hypothetical protein F082_83 [bacterium F082]|nr:MAG: hypothetical protein F082_83 [bacterium F082]KWW31832.1 MAG: hypothetical protein AUK64_81 [bacterium P201]